MTTAVPEDGDTKPEVVVEGVDVPIEDHVQFEFELGRGKVRNSDGDIEEGFVLLSRHNAIDNKWFYGLFCQGVFTSSSALLEYLCELGNPESSEYLPDGFQLFNSGDIFSVGHDPVPPESYVEIMCVFSLPPEEFRSLLHQLSGRFKI